MNDNLAEMVTEDENVNEAVEIPENQETEETQSEEQSSTSSNEDDQQESTFDVTITALFPWFVKNQDNFGDNVKYLKMKSPDIDPEEQLIIKVPHPNGGEYNGNPKKITRTFDNANDVLVLDLPPVSFDAFNQNIFRIIYQTPIEDIFIKYYGSSSRHVIFCKSVEDMLIPYSMQKVKKSDKGINIIQNDGDMTAILDSPVPMEDLILRYKQIEKHQEGINTIREAMQFFSSKISSVIDVNHLLELDRAMMSIVV